VPGGTAGDEQAATASAAAECAGNYSPCRRRPNDAGIRARTWEVPLRRIVGPLAALTAAAVVLLLAAPPALAANSIGVSFAGPVRPGQELVLSCPEGYTLGGGEADFYRDPQGRVPLPGQQNVSPTRYIFSPAGDRTVSAVWVVPRGARYANASAGCFATTSIYSAATCVFDESLGQWVWQFDYSITNASSTDQFGTVYYRIDGGERQGGWETAVPANATVSGSFQVVPDNTVERIVVIEYETTTGAVFDTGPGNILLSCP
jgi:hypothetical protein